VPLPGEAFEDVWGGAVTAGLEAFELAAAEALAPETS